MIIDPPVGPYDNPEAIKAWLDELRALPARQDVAEAIQEAERWLRECADRDSRN
jgi:hypothetical protein